MIPFNFCECLLSVAFQSKPQSIQRLDPEEREAICKRFLNKPSVS